MAQDRSLKPYERDACGEMPLDRPTTNEIVRMCVDAWNELDGDRHIGLGGSARIPFTALVTWARVHHLDREEFTLLTRVIAQLETEREVRREHDGKKKPRGKRR